MHRKHAILGMLFSFLIGAAVVIDASIFLSGCAKPAIADDHKCSPKLSFGKEVWQVKPLCAAGSVVVGSGYNNQGQYVIACAPVSLVCGE